MNNVIDIRPYLAAKRKKTESKSPKTVYYTDSVITKENYDKFQDIIVQMLDELETTNKKR